jgi:hypothetical protein
MLYSARQRAYNYVRMSESSQPEFPELPGLSGKHFDWEKLPKDWNWPIEVMAAQKAANIARVQNLSVQFSQLGVIDSQPVYFSRPAPEGYYRLRLKRYNTTPDGTFEDSSLTVLFNHIIHDHVTGETKARSKEYLGYYATGIAQLIDSEPQTLPKDFTANDMPDSMPGLIYPGSGTWSIFENPSYPGLGYNLLSAESEFEDVFRFSRASSQIAKCVRGFSIAHREE